MRIYPFQLMAAVAIAFAMTGCGNQKEARVEPVSMTENVEDDARQQWASAMGRGDSRESLGNYDGAISCITIWITRDPSPRSRMPIR